MRLDRPPPGDARRLVALAAALDRVMITAQRLQVLVPVIVARRDVVDVGCAPTAHRAALAPPAAVFIAGEDVGPTLWPVGR